MKSNKAWLLVWLLACAINIEAADIRIQNIDVHDRLKNFNVNAPIEKLDTIKMVGARNGVYSGAVVVYAPDGTIDNLKGEISPLSLDDNKGEGQTVIPANAVTVRYPQIGDISTTTISKHGGANISGLVFDTLVDTPPKQIVAPLDARKRKILEGPAQPIWVTVHVPRDSPPGTYSGKLQIIADGLTPTEIPVKISVTSWTVPDPADYRTYIGLVQSPPSIAIQYKVPEWSEEHWKLIEKSVELLGEIGNKLVHIPVVEHTQLGNNEGMVFWIKRADGGYDYDFSAFDHYIELMKQYCGAPEFIVLHIWHAQDWLKGDPEQENKVTVVDPKTGAREHMQVPVFATPESEAFWKDFLLAAKERLAKEGVADALCIGNLSDGGAHKETQAMFNRIIPDIGWWRACHSVTRSPKPYPLSGGGVVVLQEHCYGLTVPDPAQKLPEIWDQRGPGAAFMREDQQYRRTLIQYRTAAERSLYCGKRGNAREALDYWQLEMESPDGKTWRYSLQNRWPHSANMHGEITNPYLIQPGPEGALPTLRFEMFREGIQEAEAMIVVAEAQAKFADKLGPELTEECRRVFAERLTFCAPLMKKYTDTYQGWQESSARIYNCAAKVVAKRDG